MAGLTDKIAVRRYLERHIEPGLPEFSGQAGRWRHVLVIPAYREDPGLIQSLQSLRGGDYNLLVILVLNRPDSDPDDAANSALRSAALALPRTDHDHDQTKHD